jgi:hypothetical protein
MTVNFQCTTAVSVHIVFRTVRPCIPVDGCRRFERTPCLCFLGGFKYSKNSVMFCCLNAGITVSVINLRHRGNVRVSSKLCHATTVLDAITTQTMVVWVAIATCKKKKKKAVPLKAWAGPWGSSRLRLRIFSTFGTMKVVRSSPLRTGRLYPQEFS